MESKWDKFEEFAEWLLRKVFYRLFVIATVLVLLYLVIVILLVAMNEIVKLQIF